MGARQYGIRINISLNSSLNTRLSW